MRHRSTADSQAIRRILKTGRRLSVGWLFRPWRFFIFGISFICLDADVVTRRYGTPPSGHQEANERKQLPPPVGYAPNLESAPSLDGELNDPIWKQAFVLRLSRTLDGRGRAAQPTEARILRHQNTLYFGIRCTESRLVNIRSTRRNHDGEIWSDDSIEIFVGFGGSYCHFGINAVGSTYDARMKSSSWNSGFKAAAGRGENEWRLEVAIPLTSIAGEGKLPEEWIANINRNRYVTGQLQESTWSPTYSGDSHVPSRFGKLLFKDPPKGSKASAVKGQATRKKDIEFLPVEKGAGIVRFDLSDLANGVKIHRAELLVFRNRDIDGRHEEALEKIEIFPLFMERSGAARPGEKSLELVAPWFDRFDATEAVKDWVNGKTNGGFLVSTCPAWNKVATCLDIVYEGEPSAVPSQVTNVEVVHRFGQTFITWKEVSDPVNRDDIRWGELKSIFDSIDRKQRVRYCVYRHHESIAADNIHQAERVAIVRPLSCWNINGRNIDRPVDEYIATREVLMTGHLNPFRVARLDGKYGADCKVDRLVIQDGGEPLPGGTGLYVHTPKEAGQTFYAVVTSVAGVQNTRDFSDANSLPLSVAERTGDGEPILQREIPPMPFFNYKQKRLHYVRWVAPPYVNVPSQYYNWTVGVPENLGRRVPLELNFHRDGHSYWRTHYRIERDSIVLSPHDFPVKSWWYGYHESLGTLRSFRTGTIQPYTERRILAFIDWTLGKRPVDRDRILVTGCSGGASGSGALHLALQHRDLFNLAIAGHPVINYANAARTTDRRRIHLSESMKAIWGSLSWNLKTDSGMTVWQEHDMNRLVDSLRPEDELPLVTMTSRHADADSRSFYERLLIRHQPIIANFSWGGARYISVSKTSTAPNAIRLNISRGRPLLAFASSNAFGLVKAGKMGEFNRELRWKDLRESAGRLEATIQMKGRAAIVADIAPRRLKVFGLRPGEAYRWRLLSPDGNTQEGEALSSKGALIIKGVKLNPGESRLVIEGPKR
ncbi:MAG: sugar-binding protein [Planctomycetota bacterium]|nr:sugar-binding protein [Planctomycetota bacterium]